MLLGPKEDAGWLGDKGKKVLGNDNGILGKEAGIEFGM